MRTCGQCARICDNPCRLLHGPGGGGDVGAPQLRRQQMPAAENVERQIAVAVVIAVKKAPFLMPVQRVVGGIEIEDDLLWRPPMGLHKEIDKKRLDLAAIPGDPVIARRLRPAEFEPVEGALAGQWGAVAATRRQLARQHRQCRGVAQLFVIDQVLIAQRNPKHTLAHQRRHLVLDQLRCTAVRKTPGKPVDQPDRAIRRSQQQGAGIGSDLAAVKRRHHCAPFDACKTEQIRATLCPQRVSPWPRDKPLLQHDFLRSRAPMHLPCLRNPG